MRHPDYNARSPMNRTRTVTQKIRTPFGTMFAHIEVNNLGYPVGGSISHPGKEPESQIAALVEALSAGLDDVLKIGAGW